MHRYTVPGIHLLLIASLAWAGCGDDTTPPADGGADAARDGASDSGAGDAGDGGDAATLPNCEGIGDGASCGEGFICVSGRCGPSRCGDGYLNEATGELCDDGNNINGDNCKDDCTPTCVTSAECDDGAPCNGAETCVMNGCIVGILPTDGTVACDTAGVAGLCYGSFCSPPDCGNGAVDDGEDCDDGRNGDQTDGCRDDCAYSCAADTDCDDGDACNGTEACDVSTHACTTPADLECDDTDPCTADRCDTVGGCVNALIDGDGDGYSAATCTTAGLLGGDCDDADSTSYPGATELCDMADNDCDGTADNDAVTVSCQRDQDGDGFGDSTMVVSACSCPAGYIPPRGDGQLDCMDLGAIGASVNPDQSAYSPVGYCPDGGFCVAASQTFDWDCDGAETPRWTRAEVTCALIPGSPCRRAGWTGTTVPACGEAAELRTCLPVDLGGGAIGCEEVSLGMRTQECR